MSILIPEETPFFSPVYIPDLPSLSLSEDEKSLISRLQMMAWRQRALMELTDAYYRGEQIITNLRIAIPAELEFLRTIVGWPKVAVDPLVERMSIDGFRLPGATDVDDALQDVWLLNHMDAEQALLFVDAFAMGRGWILGGSPVERGDVPVMCVESPLNIAALWDSRTRKPKSLLQSYWLDSRRHAALYMPDQTVQVAEDDNAVWQIVDRDEHGLGMIPATRLANAARTNNRDGASEITPSVRSLTDQACRAMVQMAIAGEFYSVPQKIILGATEQSFQAADGTPKTAWQTYISSILGLERDENGNLPTVQQMKAYDPSVYSKQVETLAGQVGGEIGANPQELGLYTQGNPVSADAQDLVDGRRNRKARHKQKLFAASLIDSMQIQVRLMNGGVLPEQYRRMAVDWMDPADINLAGMTDAMQKQEAMGAIPGSSDVVLRKLGWNAVERKQLAQDRDDAQALELELANSMAVKAARAAKQVAGDLAPDPVVPAV